MGSYGPQGPSAVAHSRSQGNAVIPLDRAGQAQVDQMLRLAEERGARLPPGFELDAVQVFYDGDGRIDELRVAGFDLAGRPWQAAGAAPILEWRDQGLELPAADSGRRHFSAAVLDGEPPMLALLWDVTGIGEEKRDELELLHTSSSAVYQAVRDLISRAAFGRAAGGRASGGAADAVPWPSADLETREASGRVSLVPASPDPDAGPESADASETWIRRMWEESRALSDLDADVLDALLDRWLARARHEGDDVAVEVDEILRLRGLEPKRNARGYGAGFHPKQRQKVVDSLLRLQDLWVDLVEAPPRGGGERRVVRSRALVVSDQMGRLDEDGRLDVERVIFRPGRLFGRLLAGPGRRVAKLPKKALEYDPYRQGPEKRLVRYLSWQWRIRAHGGNYLQPFRVETLVQAAGLPWNPRRPSQGRERFEEALDRLQDDRVLAQWQYEDWREPLGSPRGWWRAWLEARIVLEPPREILRSYGGLTRGRSSRSSRRRPTDSAPPGERLAERRRELGWSQLQLAEHLCISRSYVSALEAGRRPSPSLARRIERWLAEGI